jgi:peptide chain release factor subunit 1
MISLLIPPKDQIAPVTKKIADELGTATNIKSRVTRQSVITALTSVQARLKLYNRVPTNGLVIYCGEIMTEDGKEKKVNIDFEPFKPINASLYLCDNKFHTEALSALLSDDTKFGFIIMDGNGALFGTLQGNTREIITKFNVELPKKHGRGGQSSVRFARLRMEKRHNYVRKVAETAVTVFITNDKANVCGLVLAGSADFKTELSTSEMFDQRLQVKILKIVDVSYGGENGFNQAIELAGDCLMNVKFIQEKKLICKYFDEIAKDTGLYCFGIDDTLRALESGAVEVLIVWENLDIHRYVLKLPNGEKKILFLKPDQIKDKSLFMNKEVKNLGINEDKFYSGLIINFYLKNLLYRPVLSWRSRSKCSCSSGSPTTTKTLARTCKLSRTSRKRARSFARASVELEVNILHFFFHLIGQVSFI